jgi:RHS repeat-associated protein
VVTELTYDARGRLKNVKHPSSSPVIEELYDYSLEEVPGSTSGVKMFRTRHTNPNGKYRDTYTNARGLTVALSEFPTTTPAVTLYGYNHLGELTSITDPEDNTSTMSYDLRGKLLELVNPDTGTILHHYDRLGNLIEKIEPNHGSTGITYSYDKSRLLSVTYPSSPSTPAATYEYGAWDATGPNAANARGRLTRVEDETGSQEYTYGDMGEITETKRYVFVSGASPEDIDFYTSTSYDSLGRMLSLTYPDGEILTYDYDAAGNLYSVTGEGSGWTETYVSSMEYDEFGNRTKAVFGSGAISTWTYDPELVRLTGKLTEVGQGGTKLQDLSYTYDLNSNPLSITSLLNTPDTGSIFPGPGSLQFEYDDLDRLTNAVGTQTLGDFETNYTQLFEYDSIHNLTRKKLTHTVVEGGNPSNPSATNYDNYYDFDPGHPHQVREVGEDINIDYDNSGNPTQITNSETNESKTLVWDDDGRLIQVTVDGRELFNYYDASGLRVHKYNERTGHTVFVNPYFDLQLSSEDPKATKHIMAGGMRVASSQTEYDLSSNGQTLPPDGRVYYFHGDHLGSSNLITNADGEVYEHLEYFADGDLWIEQKVEQVDGGYRFSGKFFDDETGFYDFGQRFYDPKASLWLGIDPLFTDTPGEAVGRPMVMGLYGYVNHSPIRFIDPDGRQPWAVCLLAPTACTAVAGAIVEVGIDMIALAIATAAVTVPRTSSVGDASLCYGIGPCFDSPWGDPTLYGRESDGMLHNASRWADSMQMGVVGDREQLWTTAMAKIDAMADTFSQVEDHRQLEVFYHGTSSTRVSDGAFTLSSSAGNFGGELYVSKSLATASVFSDQTRLAEYNKSGQQHLPDEAAIVIVLTKEQVEHMKSTKMLLLNRPIPGMGNTLMDVVTPAGVAYLEANAHVYVVPESTFK